RPDRGPRGRLRHDEEVGDSEGPLQTSLRRAQQLLPTRDVEQPLDQRFDLGQVRDRLDGLARSRVRWPKALPALKQQDPTTFIESPFGSPFLQEGLIGGG